MDDREKRAWETILQAADMLLDGQADYLRGYAQGLADANKEKTDAA